MARSKDVQQRSIERRRFLKSGALAGAAALVAPASIASAPSAGLASGAATQDAPRPPSTPVITLAQETATPPELDVLTTERSGSDFMVDVIKSLGFEYICANPGSSFRGLHESVINYGGNKAPELVTCCHEESAIAMAHGYFKIEGKPLLVAAHGTVGLQHAAMAIYNAWCDRVPVYLVLGNNGDAVLRRAAEWYHSAQDIALMVRDFTKWDDTPWSLSHFAESAVRAYKIANRGIDRGAIGSELVDPNIDYGKLAQSLGVHGEGPITDPKDLGPAIRRALGAVKRGEPALVDVVSQPR